MAWKIFYDDKESIKQKIGEILKTEEGLVYIKVNGKVHAIPVNNIVRMEEVEDEPL